MVILGDVAVPLLEKVPAPLGAAVTTTGTSPAPASEAGSVMVIKSSPKKLGLGRTLAAVIAVVPIVTVTAEAGTFLSPVAWISRTVGTCVPALAVVTLNGSIMQPDPTLVTLQTTARPPGPRVVVNMSGCEATICTKPRKTVPLLLTTTVATPVRVPMGTTK